MTQPVVTAQPAETVAVAAQRMRDGSVGSVVVIDHDDRAIGILTERDMIRLAAAGSDASTAKVSEWMTGDPDTIGPDVEARAAFARLAEHGYRHIPVVDGTGTGAEARRHRVDARPHARRDDPARRRAGARGPEGSRGRRRRRHDRRRRARPRGLLPLPPVQRRRPREDAPDRRRLAPDVRRAGCPTTLAEREAFAADIRPRRAIPPAVADVLPAIARAGETFVPLDALRTAVSQYGAALGFRPSLDIDADDAARQRDVDVRGHPDADLRAVAPAPRPRARRAAPRPRATRRTTST